MKYPQRCKLWRPVLVAAGVLGCGLVGWADPPYNNPGPFVTPVPGPGIPTPAQVPGKEYATLPNKDFAHAIKPGQTMLWDGFGGVKNGLWAGAVHHVDAMANQGDALFPELWNGGETHLVYSTRLDGFSPNRERLWVEKWNQAGPGPNSVWARTSDINHDIEDLVGVELWGPDGTSDTTHYSLVGDPGGWSVYQVGVGGVLAQATLAAAIGIPAEQPDLDALMMNGDKIIFSIAPIGPYDGGEIWTWDITGAAGAPQFLNHGGHLWNTAFDVQANTPGALSQNVDAIEAIAVPEPAAWAGIAGLLSLGGAFMARLRRRA